MDEWGELVDLIDAPWITIDDSYTTIKPYAFQDYDGVERITISASVRLIDDEAFMWCSLLKEIEVDENNKKYKSIDGNLYSKDGKTLIKYAGGKEARIFVVPSRVRCINNFAFADCDYLTCIIIGDNISSIGTQAFRHCRNLMNIMVSSDNQEYKSIDGILYSKGGKKLIKYPDGKVDGSFMIPKNLAHINDYAFDGWHLTGIFIDKNVAFISENAFCLSGGLTNINVIADNSEYKSIDGVLYNKDGTSLIKYPPQKEGNLFIIPNGVSQIACNAFANCENLTSIVFNKELISIGLDGFLFCHSLRNIYYTGTKNDWAKISIASNFNMTDKNIYFYSEIEPTGKGNYWHYIDNMPMAW